MTLSCTGIEHTLLVLETLVCATHRFTRMRRLFLGYCEEKRREELEKGLPCIPRPVER